MSKLATRPLLPAQSVTCKDTVEEVVLGTTTVRAHKTSTVTAKPKHVTKTKTVTKTSTSTVAPPDVSTTTTVVEPTSTVTISTTETSTTVTTTTTTQTQTLALPTATSYAACSADNFVTTINGDVISYAFYADDTGQQGTEVAATSQLDCCNQCQASALVAPGSCTAFFYEYDSSYSGSCYFAADTASDAQYGLEVNNGGSFEYVAGNGPGGDLVVIEFDS